MIKDEKENRRWIASISGKRKWRWVVLLPSSNLMTPNENKS